VAAGYTMHASEGIGLQMERMAACTDRKLHAVTDE
jgi:hypothetical protein